MVHFIKLLSTHLQAEEAEQIGKDTSDIADIHLNISSAAK